MTSPGPRSGPSAAAPGLGRELLAIAVAAAAPCVGAATSPANRPMVILTVVVLASAALAVVPDQGWPVRLATVAGAAVVLERAEGPMWAAWTIAALVLADIAVRRRRLLPWLRPPDPAATLPVAVLLLLGAQQADDADIGGRPARLLALAALVVLATRPIGRPWARGGHVADHATARA